jgi:hypothetical protein
MKLRLGLLRDSRVSIEKNEALDSQRRLQEALKKMKESEAIYPGVTARVRSDVPAPPPTETTKKTSAKVIEKGPKIRPLSESKAIDAGANFISEAFLFAVAGGLILLESLRSRRKESNRQDMVQERLDLLETRNGQDERRLEELECRDKRLARRILTLEEEVWKLRGGKGELPGKETMEIFKEWSPTPLWKPDEKAEGSLWGRIWNWRGPQEDAGKAVIVLSSSGAASKTKAKTIEGSNTKIGDTPKSAEDTEHAGRTDTA